MSQRPTTEGALDQLNPASVKDVCWKASTRGGHEDVLATSIITLPYSLCPLILHVSHEYPGYFAEENKYPDHSTLTLREKTVLTVESHEDGL